MLMQKHLPSGLHKTPNNQVIAPQKLALVKWLKSICNKSFVVDHIKSIGTAESQPTRNRLNNTGKLRT